MTQSVEVPGMGSVEFPDGMTDSQIVAAIKANLSPAPRAGFGLGMTPGKQRNRDVIINAANKGIAGLGDTMLNAPSNLWNLAKAGYGTVTGNPQEMTQPPNFVSRGFDAAGFTKAGNEPQTASERMMAAAGGGAAGMMVSPASSIAGLVRNAGVGSLSGLASQGTTEATGSPTAGAAVGVATPGLLAGGRAIGDAAKARADLLRSQNAVRDETLAKARGMGYVVPPSETNPSFLNNRLESLSGKAALRQEATLRNQQITNQAAGSELGLPAGTPITESVLEKFRTVVSAPYREARAINPYASQLVDDIREARAEALKWSKADPRIHIDAPKNEASYRAKAANLEQQLEAVSVNAGKADLVPELRDARTQIAKSYDIERALNLGSANVSAPTLGRAYDRGAPLTGNLEATAKFQQGPGRKFAGEGDITQTPGVSGTDMYGIAGMGSIGGHALGPVGMIAGGIPLLRGPARSLLLSKIMQKPQDYSTGTINGIMRQLPAGSKEQTAIRTILMARQLEGAQQ